MKKVIFLLIIIVLLSCKKEKSKNEYCENSILYEFVGIIEKDSISEISLPKALKVSAMNYDGILTIKDCKGEAKLELFDDLGKLILEGYYVGGEKTELIERGTISANEIIMDSIKVYKTFIDGCWNFKKLKVRTGDDLIE